MKRGSFGMVSDLERGLRPADSAGTFMKADSKERLARQFLNFAAIGVPTTLVHYSVLILLVEQWSVNPVLATTAGFLVAAFLSYYLNRRYTFEVQPEFGYGLARYYAILSIGLVLNALIVKILTAMGAMYLIAQVVSTAIVLIWNFLAARFFVFARG
jgi:putative flippase GtrA